MAKYVELGQSDNRDVDLTDVKLVKLLPETEQLVVEPTTEEQIFQPSAEKYFDEVSVGKIKTETAIVKSNESEKIVYPSKEHFFDEIQVEALVLEDITLEPTTSSQNVKASEGFDAIKSVRLNAVNPSDYYKPEESITIQPKTTPQVINPPLDHVFNLINVSAVTSEIDSNIIPTNIRKGKTILGVSGNMEADKPDQEKVVEASITNDVVVTADVGYELSKVTIPKVDVSKYVKEEISVDITPTEIEQVLIPGNNQVYNRVQVGAIPSDYVGSSIARVSEQSYIPTTTDIEIQANQFLSGKQTIKGDANLVAENIAEGKEIFGILGTHQGGSVKFSELVDGSITEVTAQDLADVTTIRDDVFSNLEITKVEIPSNVTEIGDSAFANNEISSLTLNEGIQTIGASAFANNPITTLTIPSTVTSIGISAFGGTQITELDMSNVHTPPTVDATSFPSTLTAIHVAYGDYDAYLTTWSAYADKIVRGLAIPSTITVTVNNYLGEMVSGASVTITGNEQTYTGTTDSVGVFSQGDLQPATYTISVADLEGFKTPVSQEVVVEEDTQNSVIITYLEAQQGIHNLTPNEISDISSVISANNMTSSQVEDAYGWKVGDTISYIDNNGQNIEARIVAYNQYEKSDGSGKAGVTFETTHLLPTEYTIGNVHFSLGNVYKALTGSLLETIPTNLRNVMKEVVVPTNDYSKNMTLFIPSVIEVFGDGSITNVNNGSLEGSQYEYWGNHTAKEDKIKYYDSDGDGVFETAGTWALRSLSVTANAYVISGKGGLASGGTGVKTRISYVFCI